MRTERLIETFGGDAVGRFEPGPGLSPAYAEIPVVSPDTLEGMSEVMRFATREGLRLLPAGAGEHLDLGAPFPDADVVVSTRRLRRILDYEPEDMTLVAQAGVPLREIDERTKQHGQRLGPDPEPGVSSTVGGAVAGNRFGINRASAGTMRDVVLGARVVHPDGRTSKTGGQVVKNVTGYDLAKLYVGSCGSLVLLAELSLRLGARPETTSVSVAIVETDRASDILLRLHRETQNPAALVLWAGRVAPELPVPSGRVAVVVCFEGRKSTVHWQAEQATRIFPFEKKEPEEARRLYEMLRGFDAPVSDHALLRVSSLPVEVGRVLEVFERVPGWAESPGSGFLGLFGVGTSRVRLQGPTAETLLHLERDLAQVGARVVVESAPEGLGTRRGTIQDRKTWQIAHATKVRFDPEERLRPNPMRGVQG